MKAKERLKRARVQLQKSNPFFGYLVLHLKLKGKDSKIGKVLDGIDGTCGVDKNSNLYFSEKFIDKLSEKEVKGVLAHETLHLALEVFFRQGNRDKKLFNIAQDIVINDMLVNQHFSLPDCVLIPDRRHKIELPIGNKKIIIDKINHRSSEEIYEILDKKIDKKELPFGTPVGGGEEGKQGEEGSRSIGENPLGFDEHIYEDGEGEGNKEKRKGMGDKAKQEKWKKILSKALNHAKNRGNVPAGIEEKVEEILEPKIDWREVLYRNITSRIPTDFTYQMPSKKSRSIGVYLPDTKCEGLDVIVSVDTSGSISNRELGQFLGEMVNIAETFNGVNMTIVEHDADIQEVYEVRNGNKGKIMDIDIKGRGGTNHFCVFDWLEENKYRNKSKVLVCFTDGYTSVPDKEPRGLETIWVLTNDDVGMERLNFGRIIRTT